MGVLRAPVVLALTAATSLLPLWEASLALVCLPLLVFAWALYRGRTWGAFGLLGMAAMLLFFSAAAPPEEAGLAANLGVIGGLALACFGLVAPVLWRRDALATSVAAAAVLILGMGVVVSVGMPPETVPLELELFCSGGCEDEDEDEDLPYGQRVAPWLLNMEVQPVYDQWLRVLITNNSKREILFVHPRPGSLHGLHQPVYRVEAQDADGRALELSPLPAKDVARAFGSPRPASTTLVQPGETFSVAFALPRFDGMPVLVRVTYEYTPAPRSDGYGSHVPPVIMERLLWAMFVGQINSPWTRLPLPKLKSCF